MSLLEKGGIPYLQRVQVMAERVKDQTEYPFCLPAIRNLDLKLRRPITFLVGENGSGKSTIIEAIAGLLKLPLTGGGTADKGLRYGPADDHDLASALRPTFARRPRDAYFFRGEFISHFAEVLDERSRDPFFAADPYQQYGGTPLLAQSHGEGFLAVIQSRVRDGFYLLDEPEAALSPQRQLSLMALLAERAESGAQFLIATHSPILMTIPQSEILQITDGAIAPVKLEDTDHFQITKAILQNPAQFWKHLRE